MNTVLSVPGPTINYIIHPNRKPLPPPLLLLSALRFDMEQFCHYINITSWCMFLLGAGDVWFSLKGTVYQNNSNVILEDIGEGGDALLCITNQTACCQTSYFGVVRHTSGNWFFPNGTRVPSGVSEWNFYRNRGQMMVRMNRRRGGVEGIYRCEIPDTLGFTQTIYIGVYSASTGEWVMYTPVM